MDRQMQAELNQVIRTLVQMEGKITPGVKKDMVEAAGILASAVKGRTPVGTKDHKRYRRLPAGAKKAANGAGKPVAFYRAGNLRKAMQVLRFKRSKAAFVGPKLGGKSADGYYGHFVERGTPNYLGRNFVKSAVSAAGGQTLRFAAQLISKRIAAYGKQTGLK